MTFSFVIGWWCHDAIAGPCSPTDRLRLGAYPVRPRAACRRAVSARSHGERAAATIDQRRGRAHARRTLHAGARRRERPHGRGRGPAARRCTAGNNRWKCKRSRVGARACAAHARRGSRPGVFRPRCGAAEVAQAAGSLHVRCEAASLSYALGSIRQHDRVPAREPAGGECDRPPLDRRVRASRRARRA